MIPSVMKRGVAVTVAAALLAAASLRKPVATTPSSRCAGPAPISTIRKALRAISWAVLIAFSSLCAQPTVAALQHSVRKIAAPEPTADERYAKLLEEIEEQSKKAKANRGQGKPSKNETRAIRTFQRDLEALEVAVDANFTAIEKHLNESSLAEVIKQRHRDAVSSYKLTQAEFKALLRNLSDADDRDSDSGRDAALTALSDFFDAHSQQRHRAPLDPNNLPWRTPKREIRAPIVDPAGFKSAPWLKVSGGTDGPIFKSVPPAPTADDLAATEDIQITQAIQDKANALGRAPIPIYNYVRNNIAFFPSYGSVQGSDSALANGQGNPFDTASLLIALLRAANIPARYAYGTIEVPVDQAMNWVGGATSADAVLNLLAQGGIPSAAVTSGGRITAIRLEHIWVEAWVGFTPSRGAKHIEGRGDTWVPLDPSFKQFAFSVGMNLPTNVPFDSATFLTSAQQGATVNTQEGWVQGVNQQNINASFITYQSQLGTYINSQNPNATASDVLGIQSIVPVNVVTLAGTLPYKMVAIGPKYSVLPDTLRHKFQYRLYADATARTIDAPTWTFQQSLPKLAGKKITLSFKPATQADANLIASYLPQPHVDGSPIDATEFPTSLPSYAAVTPELRVDGQVVASGGTFSLGTELAGQGGFTQYDFSGWDLTPDDSLVAGQTSALGLSAQGVGPSQLAALDSRMSQTKAALDARDLSTLTPDVVSGDLLTATIWSYFAALQNHAAVSVGPANMIDKPGLSYGLFHAAAKPVKLFGTVVTSVRFTSVLMDVGHLRHLRVAKDNSSQTWINYNRIRGQFASAMEHAMPEFYFSDSAHVSQGVSAIKAITSALDQGQKVYTINSANQSVALPQLSQSASVMQQVQDALAAGKEVLISQSPVTVGNWTGAGYAIIDPDTGAGAYLIEGGAHGGETSVCNSLMLSLQILLITAIVIALIAVIAATLPVIAAGAAFLAQAGSIIASAIVALPAAVKAAVAASLMMIVSAQASAAQIIELCSLFFQDNVTHKCVYTCPLRPPSSNLITRPQPRDFCGNFTDCRRVVPGT